MKQSKSVVLESDSHITHPQKRGIKVLQAILRIKHVPIYRDTGFELIPLYTSIVTSYSLLLIPKTSSAPVVFLVHGAWVRDHQLLSLLSLPLCCCSFLTVQCLIMQTRKLTLEATCRLFSS